MTADPSNTKPSRSEIENAVAGQSSLRGRDKGKKSLSRDTTNAGQDLKLETMAARRQQVIGGDLTGISRRGGKRNWYARLRDLNFVNWIAAAIVLAILVVFFWPQGNNDAVREITPPNPQAATSGYQGEERVDEVPTALDTTTFSRDSDMQRATEFRLEDSQSRQLRLLLDAAKQHVAVGEYSRPAGNNAVSKYQQALQIDANNVEARQGLGFINGRFLAAGYAALEEDNESLAQTTLKKLQKIDPNSDESLELDQAIKAFKVQEQISALLEQATKAQKAGQLILPARQNALYFYQQIFELDATNQAAQKGVESVADEFVNKANKAVMQGDLQAATGYLATVSVIDAKHQSIPLIESMIASAKPIAATVPSQPNPKPTNQNVDAQSNSGTAAAPDKQPATAPTPRRPTTVSSSRTPAQVARERAEFDRRYLQRGLDAYYRGDYDEAAALLQPLADKGVSRAQFRIGYMYYLGRGFDRNVEEADRIIRAALPAVQKFADEGRGWAQSDIGSLYEDGLVLPRNYADAIYWYRSAAEQGYPGAQTNLGVMYARGRGVTASRRTAVEWFQRAAKQGDIAAIRNLEAMGIKP